MVNESHEQGLIHSTEAEMIENIFEFDDKDAADIMTHRTNINAFSCELTLSEAVDQMLEGHNSRYPVYRDSLDDIIGILHFKDAMKAWKQEELRNKKLCELDGLLRKAYFIPETRNISKLFRIMQSKKIHIVIVIDEYGQVEGLITMEDILEEIVGNILDEYDEDETFIQQSQDGYVLKGMTPIEDVEKALHIQFGEDAEFDTLNGFLISELDRIPGADDRPCIESLGWRFEVLRVVNNTIEAVRATRLEDGSAPDPE